MVQDFAAIHSRMSCYSWAFGKWMLQLVWSIQIYRGCIPQRYQILDTMYRIQDERRKDRLWLVTLHEILQLPIVRKQRQRLAPGDNVFIYIVALKSGRYCSPSTAYFMKCPSKNAHPNLAVDDDNPLQTSATSNHEPPGVLRLKMTIVVTSG